MKRMLLSLCVAFTTFGVVNAQTIANGGFDDWGSTPLTANTPIEGFDKYDLTSVTKPYPFANIWEISGGNATKETNFGVVRTTGREGGYCLVYMSNHASNDSRFYNTTPLTLGVKNYKVKFWIRGKATIKNIVLSKKSTDPTGAEFGQTSSTTDIIVPMNYSSVCKAYDLSDVWTEITANFSIIAVANYKIYFSIFSSAPIKATESTSNFFMIDDITIEEDADPTVCTLSNLTLKGSKIDNFNASTGTYNVTVAQTSIIPTIAGVATDSRATIEYTQITNLSGTEEERTATAIVTAADGTSKKTYKVILSMTNDALLEGIRGDAVPEGWVSSTVNSTYATWWTETAVANNNGQYWGASSLRPRAGDATTNVITAGDLTLPQLSEAEQLSFYIKSSSSSLPATLTPKWKLASETNDVWTELETIASFPTTYEQKSYTIHQSIPIIIRFSFTKTDLTTFPFYIDDVKVTKYTNPSSVLNNPIAPVIYVENYHLIISIEHPEAYRVTALDGRLIAQGVAANATIELFQGIYFVEIAGQMHKVAAK